MKAKTFLLSPLTVVIQSELRINWGLFGYIHGSKWPRWRAYDIYTLLYFIVILLYTSILESQYKCILKLCIIIFSHTDLIKESLDFYNCFVSLLHYRIFRLQEEETEVMQSSCWGGEGGKRDDIISIYCIVLQ